VAQHIMNGNTRPQLLLTVGVAQNVMLAINIFFWTKFFDNSDTSLTFSRLGQFPGISLTVVKYSNNSRFSTKVFVLWQFYRT